MQFHKPIQYNETKRQELILRHKIDLLEVLKGELLAYYPKHPFNSIKYPNQQVFIINYNNYPYFVPFVEENDYIFIKNCIPERRFKFLMKGEK